MLDVEILTYSLLGGIIPAIFWLKFWLKEDVHSEPRGLILGTFIGGMLAVFIALILQRIVNEFVAQYTLTSFFFWAMAEEAVKYGAAVWVALRTRFVDEPIDATIYLITAALGFAAFENTLYVLEPFSNREFTDGLLTLNIRFIGASLLHVLCSGIIGIGIASSFYSSQKRRRIIFFSAFLIATLLHTAFNHFIIKGTFGTIGIFSIVWIGIIAVILILEKIKNIKRLQH